MTLRFSRRLWRRRRLGFFFGRQPQIQWRHLPTYLLPHLADHFVCFSQVTLRLLLCFDLPPLAFDLFTAPTAASEHANRDDKEE